MTSPKPRTIDDVAAPFENYLVPMPAPASDVCLACHSSVYDGYTTCYPCNEARRKLHGRAADAVASVALAPANEQLARDLYSYKDSRIAWSVRQPQIVGLAAVLYKWLHHHEQCLARAAGVTGAPVFDAITSVPSTSGRVEQHPLVTVLTKVVTGSEARYSELLAVRNPDLQSREVAEDRFAATRALQGSVLLIDDSWVSGAKPQCASAALKAGGASVVAVLTIGRWFKTDYAPNVPWLREKRKAGWDWNTCCLH